MSITIMGRQFTVPDRYTAGVPITPTEGEAQAFNQTYHENLRNNRAQKWTKGFSIEKGVPLPEDKVAECQADLDTYAASYQFGVRVGGGGGRTAADPTERRAIKLIKAAIRAQVQNASAEAVNTAVEQVRETDKFAKYMDLARRQLLQEQRLAAETMAQAAE